MTGDILLYQWVILILLGVAFYFLAPLTKSASSFFAGQSETDKAPGLLLLASSVVISWIFAKSITNAANLGESYGIVGGFAYAVYYFSFFTAGVIIYQMRKKGGFKSIHHFIRSKYGRVAVLLFSLLIGIRLFNEVWSNTLVIGSYFGERGSTGFIIAIVVFTITTLAYSLKGGFRSSLITDAIQMVLFSVLLFVVLSIIFDSGKSLEYEYYLTSGEWTFSAGLNLALAAFIQIFSYPFHDPVLTDCGFLSDEKTTLKSFIWAGIIGFIAILLFSFIGIFAQQIPIEGLDAPVQVGRILGPVMMLMLNVIMISSAGSTLDSTFASSSKLAVVDLFPDTMPKISTGRRAMIAVATLGSLPLLLSPKIIQATTISGTMVIGLAPVFIFWKMNAPPLSYYLSIGFGLLSGIILTLGLMPDVLIFTEGVYAPLLAVNVYGSILCFAGFLLPAYFSKGDKSEPPAEKVLVEA